jgi:MarR family transcriptional regulator, 2-MHQ and catechol-resistance regulon repressor
MGSRVKAGASKEPTSVALMDAVSAFMRAYKSRIRSILTEVSSRESTPSRVMVVVVLRKSGPLPMGTIAAHVGLPKSNITALVDDLEAEGVLRRKRDEADRRITQVELTAKGRALCAREYDAYESSLAAFFDTVPAAERAAMLSGLERLTRRMRDDDAAAPASSSRTQASAPAPWRRQRRTGRARRA